MTLLGDHYLVRLGQLLRKYHARFDGPRLGVEEALILGKAIRATYRSCCEQGSGEEANVLLAGVGLVVEL